MKRLLIISPHFPPANTADMQRVRMSLPYFKENGWEAEVVTVNEKYLDVQQDHLLLQSLPNHIKIHKVKALSKKWTSKLGFGSLALRSMWFYIKTVNELLKKDRFDLIYFSTTEFPICILGAYWKKRYGIPYLIDMQDPWHSDYYQDKPKHERPAKHWFSYRLHKYLEPFAMQSVGGLIAVSQAYIDTLKFRYSNLKEVQSAVIIFGAFKPDLDFVKANQNLFRLPYQEAVNSFNIIYVGRGGHDMKSALTLLFIAFKKGLAEVPEIFNQMRFHFIGTSYAPKGKGVPTIQPLANEMGLNDFVNEQTDRISFYQSVYTLTKADALLVIGSDDPKYTASKIYPYILAQRPMLAFFHPDSSASNIIRTCSEGEVISLASTENTNVDTVFEALLSLFRKKDKQPTINWEQFAKFDAKNMTTQQCELFNLVLVSSLVAQPRP